MRVVHLTRDFPPRSAGGLSTAVGGLVRHLARRGLTCAVISFDGWRPRAGARGARARREDAGATEVLRLSDPGGLAAVRRFASEFGPALVHVHDGMLWEIGAEIAGRAGAGQIFTAHTCQYHQGRLRGLDRPTLSLAGQTRALAEADLITAPSRFAAERLASDHPDARARIRIARLGIDDSPRARAAAGLAVPEDRGLENATASPDRLPGPIAPEERRRGGPVLYAGRFSDLTGTADLFAAMPEVLARVPDARFVVAGGVPESPKREARFRRRVVEAALPPVRRATELPGWLSPGELGELYAGAACLVSPSWLETFGLVVLEAMLHGVPIAATRSGAVEELVVAEESALLVPPRDPAALARAVVRLLRDPDLALALGAAASRAARRNLWDRRITETLAVYGEARA